MGKNRVLKVFSQRDNNNQSTFLSFVDVQRKYRIDTVIKITGINDNKLLKFSRERYPEFYEIVRQIISHRPRFEFVHPTSPIIQFHTEKFGIILNEDEETIQFDLRPDVKIKNTSKVEKFSCFTLMITEAKIMKYILESTYLDEDEPAGFNMGDFLIFLQKEDIPF